MAAFFDFHHESLSAMNSVQTCDISLAVTGSGGAGAITAGELLLSLAGKNNCFGMMRRSFGPQIRGGEAAALIRISHIPVECMNDSCDLLLALDWRNADRFAHEIALRSDSVIIADLPLVKSLMLSGNWMLKSSKCR